MQIVEQAEDLISLRSEWPTLEADFQGPSNHLEWWIAQAQVPEPDTSLCVVVLRDGGRLVGIAPLLRAHGLVGRLRTINCDDAAGFLYTDEHALARLVDVVLGLRRAVALPSLVAGSPTDRVLHRRARQARCLRWSDSYAMGPSIVLDERFEAQFAPLSSKRRKSMRRALRKAQASGEVSFHVDEVGDDLSGPFQELLRLEGSGWKGREGTAIAQDIPQRDRIERFISSPRIRDDVRFAWMRIDGRPIAVELAVLTDRRMWVIKGGYDEAFSHCSPGLLLELHMMSWAAQEGLERFELMGRMEDWKRTFGDGVPLLHTRVYPPTPRGLLAIGLEAVRHGRRGVWAHVRTWWAARGRSRA